MAQFGPWRAFLRDQLLQGHFPLWNPYLLGGCPFLADLQNMVFYPLNWLTIPFSVPTGLSLFFCLHLFLALLGMDLLLKSFGLDSQSRLAGALVYSFSNFFWLEIIHPPVLAAFTLLPWLFGCLRHWAETLSVKWGFLSGFCFALLFLCGSIQMSIGAFYGGLIFFGYELWVRQKNEKPLSLAPLLFPFLAAVWGALPLFAQLIPSLEFSKLTDRGEGIPWAQLKHSLSLDPSVLYQLFLPRLQLPEHTTLGEAVQIRDGAEKWATNFQGLWAFMGIWTPLLALAAVKKKTRELSAFWFWFALGGLILSLGQFTPLYHALFSALPGLSLIRVAYRYVFLWVLALGVLTAFGWKDIFSETEDRLGKYLPWIYGLLLFLAAFLRPAFNWREILALGFGFLALAWKVRKPSDLQAKKWLALYALGIPLFLNVWGNFEPGPSSNFDFEKNSSTLVAWGRSLSPGRVFFDNTRMYYPIQVGGTKYILNYPQNAAAPLGIKDIGGYNPLVLQAKTDLGTLPLPLVTKLGAIAGFVTGSDQGKHPGFVLNRTLPYYFYTSTQPPHFVFAPRQVVSAADSQSSLALLRQEGFDPDQTAVLLTADPVNLNLGGKPPALTYKVLADEPEAQAFEVTLSRFGLVVFCETQYPGWKAWVDGNPASILTADHLLRALVLNSGTHRVDFRFEPYWWPGIAWGLAGWVFLTLLGAFLFRPMPRKV